MLCTGTALPISDLWHYFISVIKHKKKWLFWDLNWDDDILEYIKLAPMENNSLKAMGYWMNRTTQLKVAT
jgi:hypothetical protein